MVLLDQITNKIEVKSVNDNKEAYSIAEKSEDYFQGSLSDIKRSLDTDKLYGALSEDKMVAFISYKEVNPEVVEITWMAVLPEFRGIGIGSKLVLVSLSKMKKKYKLCEVKTLAETREDTGYSKTRNFYKKLGFIALEIISPYPGWKKDNPCQIFVKPL